MCTRFAAGYLINLIKMFSARRPSYKFARDVEARNTRAVPKQLTKTRLLCGTLPYRIDYGLRLSNCGQVGPLPNHCPIYFVNWPPAHAWRINAVSEFHSLPVPRLPLVIDGLFRTLDWLPLCSRTGKNHSKKPKSPSPLG